MTYNVFGGTLNLTQSINQLWQWLRWMWWKYSRTLFTCTRCYVFHFTVDLIAGSSITNDDGYSPNFVTLHISRVSPLRHSTQSICVLLSNFPSYRHTRWSDHPPCIANKKCSRLNEKRVCRLTFDRSDCTITVNARRPLNSTANITHFYAVVQNSS